MEHLSNDTPDCHPPYPPDSQAAAEEEQARKKKAEEDQAKEKVQDYPHIRTHNIWKHTETRDVDVNCLTSAHQTRFLRTLTL